MYVKVFGRGGRVEMGAIVACVVVNGAAMVRRDGAGSGKVKLMFKMMVISTGWHVQRIVLAQSHGQ